MKKFLVIIAAVAATLFAVACNKEQNAPDEPQQQIAAGEQITINASIPADITKVGLAYTGSGLHPTWSAGDKIRLADHSNSSNYQDFTLTAGEGTQNGTFSGTAVSASSFDISLLTTNWPADILAQTQAADESTAHLGYQLTLSGVSTYEDISFTSAWASSKGGSLAVSGALHLQVTLPSGVAAQVNNVTMVADKNIFGATGTMTIALSSQADNGTDNTLDVFATIPSTGVVIPSGTALLFKFGTTDPNHSVYTRYYKTSSALNLAGGQLNLIALTGTNTDKYAGKNDDGSAEHP
ncbi:MAG: hypothetical protein K6F21_06195, partial [Bacteroidales bacterium]|nr:hypothetical protein [Bacteroidales bacterium]